MNVVLQEKFSRLQFPVHKLTAKSPTELFEAIPGLYRYFTKMRKDSIDVVDYSTSKVDEKVTGYSANYRGLFPDDLVKVIKYIIFVYDPDSDLPSEYHGDTRLLKEAACKEAGFSRTTEGEWPLYIQDIMDFKEKEVTTWILDYLKVKKNSVWTEIKLIEEELETLNRQRAAAMIRGEVRSDLMKFTKDRNDERDQLYKRFYAEHTDLRKATEDDLYPVSPENVFKELKVPPEKSQVRQIKDVPKDTRIPEIHNR